MKKMKITDLVLGKATKPVEKATLGAVCSEAKVYVPEALLNVLVQNNADDWMGEAHRLFRAMKDIQYARYRPSVNGVDLIIECVDGSNGIFRYVLECEIESQSAIKVINWECLSHIKNDERTEYVSTKTAYRSRYFNRGE